MKLTAIIALLFLCVGSTSAILNLVKFSQAYANASGALCNDGSPGAYYIQNGTVNKFIIYLQGGALCFDPISCAPRVGTPLATSVNYPATQPAFIIPDKPQWTSWTKVYVPYCSSDIYSGTVTTPTAFGFIFAGNLILKAIFRDLINNFGLNGASEVIFWGDSAGAVGVINNIDLLASFIPGARVQGVANSGWFISHATFNGLPTIAQLGALTRPEYGARVNTACMASNRTDCYLTPTVYPFIKQKIFFIQSFIDSFEIGVELGFGTNFSIDGRAFFEDVAALYKTDLAQFQSKAGDDYYLLTCFLHVPDITIPYINGIAAVDAVVTWYFTGVSSHLADKCNVHNATLSLFQNPTQTCDKITATCLQDATALPPLFPAKNSAFSLFVSLELALFLLFVIFA